MSPRSRALSVLAAGLVAVLSIAAFGQQPAAPKANIWDKQIMKQPFDKQPFYQVRIPEWVQDTVGAGYTLSGASTEQRAQMAQAGITLSEMGFVDPFFVYYDSALLKKRSPHVPPDKLEKEIAEYKKYGIRILGVYPPCLQGEAYETHPEWRRIGTNTTEIPQIDMVKFPHGGMLCLLGPYGDFFIDVLAEIVTKFPDVDAFSFDGLHYAGVCYCKNCRDAFRKDTGQEIPNVDLENPAFRSYQHWADRRMENLIQRMQTRLKGIKPDVALVTWTTNAGRFGHFRDIPRNMPARMNLLLDAPDQEFWLDETNRGATVVPSIANAYIWAVTNHRVAFSEPYLMSHGNPYGKDSFPPHEVFRRMMLACTWGSCPSLAVLQPPHLQQGVLDCLAELKKRKPWLTHKSPEPWAALVLSDNTRVLYGRSSGQVEERYMSNVFGAFRAMMEEHLPMAIINDWNLNPEDLAPYKVLILPNTACLNDEQVAGIRQFVENGGGLVASVDTSLFDDLGNPRDNFALGDVLGVTYQGLPTGGGGKEELDVNFAKGVDASYWEKRKNVFSFQYQPSGVDKETGRTRSNFLDQGLMKTYVGGSEVVFKGQAVRVGLKGKDARSLGDLKTQNTQDASKIPAVVSNTFGKGKVVYLAAGFDSAYYLYSYPYHRLVLKSAVTWAASAPPAITIDAPMCVQSSTMRQKKDGERLIVHLFNDVNTTAFHALPNDDVPLREEVLPVHDIPVTFKGYAIKRIHLEPAGVDLEMKKTADGVQVVVPKLEVHSMVVAELGS